MSYQSDNTTFNNAMDSLSHHGVLGMKWGVRNKDTLRKYAGPKGRSKRYGSIENVDPAAFDEYLHDLNLKGLRKTDPYFDTMDVGRPKSLENNAFMANLGGEASYWFREDRRLNCVNTTLAFLLRECGYDVVAKSSPITLPDASISIVFDSYPHDLHLKPTGEIRHGSGFNEPKYSKKDIEAIENKIINISASTDSNMGFIGGRFAGSNSGHAMAYKINGDKITVIDAQDGKIYNDASESYLREMASCTFIPVNTKNINTKAAANHVASTKLIKYIDAYIPQKRLDKNPSYVSRFGRDLIDTMPEKPASSIDDAYVKAAREYLKYHPLSKMTLTEITSKYRNEWEGE